MDFLPEVGNLEDLLLKSSEKKKVPVFLYFKYKWQIYFQPEKTAQYKTLKSLRAKLGRLIGYIDEEVLPILKWDAFRKKTVHFAIAVSNKWYQDKTWIITFSN